MKMVERVEKLLKFMDVACDREGRFVTATTRDYG